MSPFFIVTWPPNLIISDTFKGISGPDSDEKLAPNIRSSSHLGNKACLVGSDILLKKEGVFHLFRRMMEMERSPFLPLPEGMVIGQVAISATQLTVEVISTQPSARCPECGYPSEHVHCQYQRTVHDVPCGGRHIVLRLGVRKFACWTATCPRKVFAEKP